MPRADLDKRAASSVSVCGKMLRKGQTILVDAQAVGPRERKMESRGRIKISPSNKAGKLRIRAQ